MTAAELNAVSDQKDTIIISIQNAEDAQDLKKAWSTLGFVAAVWNALGYHYKTMELGAQIRARAATLRKEEATFLAGLRKNAACRGSVLRNIAALLELEES